MRSERLNLTYLLRPVNAHYPFQELPRNEPAPEVWCPTSGPRFLPDSGSRSPEGARRSLLAGPTHAAARVGIPQVVVPHLLDPHYRARRVRAPEPFPRPRAPVALLTAASPPSTAGNFGPGNAHIREPALRERP